MQQIYNQRLIFSGIRTPSQILTDIGSFSALRGLYSSRVLVIASKSNKFIQNGNLDNIKCDYKEVIYKSWSSDPSYEELIPSISIAQDLKPDVIIAIGGGSVIDAAKIIWAVYENNNLNSENIFTTSFSLRNKSKFIAIPSTVGSGSEVSSSAVLFDNISKKKIPVISHQFLPDLVILDPNILADLPNNIILSSLCDALTHALEGYVSKIKNPIMNYFAEQTIKIVNENIEQALEKDLSSLLNLQVAALYGGYVQNHCLVGISHAIAHEISSFGIPHAEANAILMPHVIEMNACDENTKALYNKIAKNISDVADYQEIINIYNRFIDMGKFSDFKSYQLKIEDLNYESIINDEVGRFNPTPITKKNIKEIIIRTL
mgnify:CR=1 FL=1|tara:strand:+ start:13129 stop:14253 length:1125 start_codon:yes stop_codon:yes gene_type:complete